MPLRYAKRTRTCGKDLQIQSECARCCALVAHRSCAWPCTLPACMALHAYMLNLAACKWCVLVYACSVTACMAVY